MAYAGPYAGDDTGPYSSSGDPYSDFEKSYASPAAMGGAARYSESDYLEELEGGLDTGGKFFESLTYTCGTGYLAGLMVGSGYSFLNGYANARKMPNRNSRVVFNAVANSIGKHGTRTANLSAVLCLLFHVSVNALRKARQKEDMLNFLPVVGTSTALACGHYAHKTNMFYKSRPFFIFKGVAAATLAWTWVTYRYERWDLTEAITSVKIYKKAKKLSEEEAKAEPYGN